MQIFMLAAFSVNDNNTTLIPESEKADVEDEDMATL